MGHNYNDNEKLYFEERKKFLKDKKLLPVIDQPMLFASRQAVCNVVTRVKLFELIKDVKGSIIECGVHKGSNFMLFNHLSALMEPYAFDRKIVGFDTFEGFPSTSHKDGGYATVGEFGDTDKETIQKAIDLSDLNRPLGHIKKGELIKGNAISTIPAYVNDHPELVIAMLYLDFDLYEPTMIALRNFYPRMPKGSVIVFDQLNAQKWQGETIAVKEFFGGLKGYEIKKFSHDPRVSYTIVGGW